MWIAGECSYPAAIASKSARERLRLIHIIVHHHIEQPLVWRRKRDWLYGNSPKNQVDNKRREIVGDWREICRIKREMAKGKSPTCRRLSDGWDVKGKWREDSDL